MAGMTFRRAKEIEVAQYGVWIGIGLVALATAVALLIGAKAARSVQEFRAEEHETFAGKDRP